MNLNNINNEASNNEQWNPEVEERLKWWAEKHNKSLDDAFGEFYTYLKTDLGIDNANNEDDEFLIEAAESFIVERRVMDNTSSSKSVKLVGLSLIHI